MELQARLLMALAALSGLMAVAFGAFAAHGVSDPQARAWLQTGGHYQLVHALAVFAALMVWRVGASGGLTAGWLFLAGGFVFALTLYLMGLGGPRWLGAVTPIGGVLMIVGWAVLAWAAFFGTRGTLV
jgi:uncharacterized membrane protein YgdD (TMEM256/DUF423 family)